MSPGILQQKLFRVSTTIRIRPITGQYIWVHYALCQKRTTIYAGTANGLSYRSSYGPTLLDLQVKSDAEMLELERIPLLLVSRFGGCIKRTGVSNDGQL
jgi:hypothetical protein